MELDELRKAWIQHEEMLVKHTVLNKELLMKVLIKNTEKRIDWLKIRSLAGLILPFILIIFIVIPRIQFSLELDVVIGIILFVPLYIISYTWAIKLYLYIERLNPNGPITTVSKQLKLVEKYKLRITRNGYIIAPFMIVENKTDMSFLNLFYGNVSDSPIIAIIETADIRERFQFKRSG